MRVSRREGVLIVLCVLVVAFVGVPTLRQYGTGGDGRSTGELTRARDRARAESVRLRREVALLEREAKALTWPLAPDQLPPVLLKRLEGVASRCGMGLAAFRPGRPVAVASGGKVPVTVQVRAPFPKAAAFLERLRAEEGRIALERMRLVATDAGSDVVNLELRLAVYTATPPSQSSR